MSGTAADGLDEADVKAATSTTFSVVAGRNEPVAAVVVSFDHDRGLGQVELADGTALDFHCVAISDGSRSVEVAAKVACTVGPSHSGSWEARSVTKL